MSKGSNRRLRVTSADFPSIGTSLLNVVSSGHEIDLADDRFLTVMIPTRGRTQVRMERSQRTIQEGAALALGPSERWTRVEKGAHREFRASLAKISLDAVPVRQILPMGEFDPVLPIASSALPGFKALIQYMFSDLASAFPTLIHRPASDLFAALVIEHVRQLFLGDPATDPAVRPQTALVRRAEEFMAANLGDPLTVPMIADACGVTARQLQDAFRRTVGQTPWERLTARRMAKARQGLLLAERDTVTGIAFDCGFSHLGRFAQAYRAEFGEAPSVTLQKAQAKTGAIRTSSTQIG